MMGELLLHGAIVACTCSAIWLLSRPERWMRWGFVVGLIGQPFWLYSTLDSAQWGPFIVSLFFTAAWIKGVREHFWAR